MSPALEHMIMDLYRYRHDLETCTLHGEVKDKDGFCRSCQEEPQGDGDED